VTGWGYDVSAELDHPSDVDRLLSKPTKVEDLRQALVELTTPPSSQRQFGRQLNPVPEPGVG